MSATVSQNRPRGVWALIAFFVIASLISGVSALSLAFPGSALDAIWHVKPAARMDFAQLGSGATLLLLAVFAWMAIAASGLWLRKGWGWWAAVGAFVVNLLSDAAHSIKEPSNLIGLPI